jgi:pyroglutamyl-peptidase
MGQEPNILLTGFEGYGGRGLNPAAEVVRALDGETVGGARVTGAVLPVSYRRLAGEMTALVRSHRPRVVICLGLWPGEPVIRLERFGANLNAFEIPDNTGLVESGPIEPGGPAARAATLPVDAILSRLLEAGIPARLSSTAGNFLCNALLYETLGIVEREAPGAPCGFIHVPYLPAQVADMIAAIAAERALELHQRADLASMALDTMVEGIRIAIETSLKAER